jgi:arginyl-tRNA synthetase
LDVKQLLIQMIRQAYESARSAGEVTTPDCPPVVLDVTKQKAHGDYACTLGLILARLEGKKPRDTARMLVRHLSDPQGVLEKVEVAGPGFINLTVRPAWWRRVVNEVAIEGERYGRSHIGDGKRIQIEYVSANPTGPLHVGHGRWAAFGSALARLLQAAGYTVETEFYINDAGRQVKLLALSVYAKYQQILGIAIPDPEDGYRGEHIGRLAQRYLDRYGKGDGGRPAEECLDRFRRFALEEMLAEIREDLEQFGIRFDSWYSEATLFETGVVERTLEELSRKGHLYEKDGAVWFRSTAYGDDKDRVVRKEDGEYTYLASDIAYHQNKLSRGFDRLINIWGADHHGYVARMEAVVQALGHPKDRLAIRIGQLVSLLRSGRPVAMSKRAGEYVTLRDVVSEVGRDAALYFFLMRKLDTHLEFDLELAKRQSTENPVYYVQYAHARLSSVMRQAGERGITPLTEDRVDLDRLTLPEEMDLLRQLAQYPDLVEGAAEALEPHRLIFYLQDLAALLHHYYFQHRILSEDDSLTQARLALTRAVRTVLRNGLGILGVAAPDRM